MSIGPAFYRMDAATYWSGVWHDFWSQVAIAALLGVVADLGVHLCSNDDTFAFLPCLDCGAGL